MKQIKQKLADELSETLDAEVEGSDIEIPEPEHGDFAYPAMKAASQKEVNPRKLAEQSAEALEQLGFVESVNVAGPGYLNFSLNKKFYAEEIEQAIGSDRMGAEKKDGRVLVEFSSPNLAKPMHIGHLRNNVLGDSIQRIMRFLGYDVTSENYIGDWGTKHGQTIYAYKLWGSEEEFEEKPMEHMYSLYVKLNQEADEETQEKAREWSKKIEEGEDEAFSIWEKFREATIEYNEKEYERMNISFDRWTGESKVAERAEEIIQEGLEKGIFKEDEDGSVYVEFESDLPSTVVKRSDGSTLYISRDIANIEKREKEGFDQNLYIVASEQDLHFQQLFETAEMFSFTEMENQHISYGMLHLEEGSMSSSKGNIIELSEVMDKAEKEAEKRIEDKDIDNAEKVGLGAIRYANLSVSRQKDIEFDWESVLSFEGDSGPYLQYSNVRAKSILKKTEKGGELSGKFTEEEYRLLKNLAEFPEKVEAAAEKRDPAKVANYLSTLSEEFNSFYHDCPVLGEDEKTTKRRLRVVELFVDVTDQGLELLGIEPLEEM